MIRKASKLLFENGRGGNSKSEKQLKQIYVDINSQRCKPPLPQDEIDSMWKDAFAYYQRNKKNNDGEGIKEKEVSQAQKLLQIAKEKCQEFFVDQYGSPYAAVRIRDHGETLHLNSERFRNWICRQYYELEGSVPNSESITNAVNVLKANAEFDGNTKELHIRVARSIEHDTTTIHYDMTNSEWEAVKITSEGRSIEKSPGIFRRYNNQQPQIYPSKEYPPDIFHKFMELVNVMGEKNKLLLVGYIIALFFPDIPKPILMLHGEQGSAKSTLQELIKMLVDPSSIRTLAFPKDIDQLIQQLAHNHVAYFDNISIIRDWISDQLCRAVTGSGFSKRQLWTDDDDIIYYFKRCIGFNGINLGATKADLLDRGMIIQLERIPKDKIRKLDDIWEEFEKIKPQLLGYIFDIMTKVLRLRQTTKVELKEHPRMADFAELAEIISRCMGNRDYLYLDAYYENIELQTEEVLEASPVGTAMIKFMNTREEWTGSATQLFGEMDAVTAELKINTKNKLWPKSPNVLSRKLNEVKTNLADIGIVIERAKDTTTKTRIIKIRKISSPPSPASRGQNNAQSEDKMGDDIGHDIGTVSPQLSFPTNELNHAQIESGDDRDDRDDIWTASKHNLADKTGNDDNHYEDSNSGQTR
jgi:hypothetical protein